MSDQTPPERIAELEDRIEQLEATIRKMLPGRRDALKLGGAAALGAAAFSGTASAGSSQVGTIGSSSDRVDINAEDIDVSDTINTQTIQPRNIGNGYHYAAAFDGADPDARLANAITGSNISDTIILEKEQYSTNTISARRVFQGIRTGTFGTSFVSNVTFNETVCLKGITFTGDLILNQNQSYVHDCNPFFASTVELNGDQIHYVNNRGGDVVVNANACVVANNTFAGVTDNGSANAIGNNT